MKKYIFAIIALFFSIATINAQEQSDILIKEKWHIASLGGDELLERETQEIYTYFTKDGYNLVYYASRPNLLVIALNKRIFDFSSIGRYSSTKSVDLVIGYYDENDNLVDKEKTILLKLGDGYDSGMLGSEKVMNYMRTQKGYIRFIADVYNGNDFDAKVPTWKMNVPVKVKGEL